jgi:hypothetical protein
VYKTQQRLNKLRAQSLKLENPSALELQFKELYDIVRTPRQKRPKDPSISAKADEILHDQAISSAYRKLTLALRDVTIRKCTAQLHRSKCFNVEKLIQETEVLGESFTPNEKESLEKVSKLVKAMLANQFIPGDFF